MWSERLASRNEEQAATELSLHDLIAMRPPYLRGPYAPGQRMPGGERSGRGRASSSLEFDGIGPYEPGDDVRRVDWRATARIGWPQVRRFVAESHCGRMIVADLSADLCFGTRQRLMVKTVALAAAYLAWESMILNEPVGLSLPDREPVPPRRGRRHVLRLFDALLAGYHSPTENRDLGRAASEGSALLRSGDELCVISDFVAPMTGFEVESRGQAEMRRLRAFIVEDPITHAPLSPGVFPARERGSGRRHVFRIGRRAADRAGLVAEAQRTERIGQLRDGGWHVHNALELLPRHAGARQ